MLLACKHAYSVQGGAEMNQAQSFPLENFSLEQEIGHLKIVITWESVKLLKRNIDKQAILVQSRESLLPAKGKRR